MKHFFVAVVLAAVVAIPAQDVRAQDTRVGLGVGINEGLSIFVPIDFGSFRLEPQLGFRMMSSESGNVDRSSTTLILGTGIFAEGAEVANTVIYYGGRLGIVQNSEKVETPAGETDESTLDFFLGPAVGVEYFFSDRFSLGGEAQLIFTMFGEEDDEDDTSASQLQTQGTFFVRWYF